MTNKEYVQSIFSRFGVGEVEVNILFAENENLNPNDNYNKNEVNVALYNSFSSWIPMFESRSEGDMSVKWNWNAIKSYAANLSKSLNKDNPFDFDKPKVKPVNFFH